MGFGLAGVPSYVTLPLIEPPLGTAEVIADALTMATPANKICLILILLVLLGPRLPLVIA
jgi:hypothetical protein